jgi:hypothetical protein
MGDAAQAAVLDRLLDVLRRPRLAIVRGPGGDAERGAAAWARVAAARGQRIGLDLPWGADADVDRATLARLRRARPDAVLSWTGAVDSARLLRGLRETGIDAAFAGGPDLVDEAFARLAPPGSGLVLAAAPCDHPVADAASIAGRSFTATAHLLAAVGPAGTDRLAVRDELERRRAASVVRLVDGDWVPSAKGVGLGGADLR